MGRSAQLLLAAVLLGWLPSPAQATVMRGIDTEMPAVGPAGATGESDEDRAVTAYLKACVTGAGQGCDPLRKQAVPILKEDLLTLGANADPAYLPLLADMLDSDEPELRTAAADAIGMIGPTPAETPALAALLDDTAPLVRTAAYMALEQSRDPGARPVVDRSLMARARAVTVDDPESITTIRDHFIGRRDDSRHLKEAYNYTADPAHLKELETIASDRGDRALAQEEKVYNPTINLKTVENEQPSRAQVELAQKWYGLFEGTGPSKAAVRATQRGDALSRNEQEPSALEAAIRYYELAGDDAKIGAVKAKAEKLGDAWAGKDDLKKAVAYYQVAENDDKMKAAEERLESRIRKQTKEMQKDESQQKQFKKEQEELEKELGF
jgi:hypothetical protein